MLNERKAEEAGRAMTEGSVSSLKGISDIATDIGRLFKDAAVNTLGAAGALSTE